MKIGIDIDEVVVEFVKHYLIFHEKKFGIKLVFDEIYRFELDKIFGVEKNYMDSLIEEFFNTNHFNNPNFIEYAKESISNLSKNHELFFITSRNIKLKERTKYFFKEHFPEKSFEIIFSGELFGGKSKEDICKELGVEIMIEDNADYAVSCAKRGIKAFLLDKPWNQKCDYHENIIRVKNWKEIMERINEN